MFHLEKIKTTLESLRANATLLRDKGDLADVSIQALELQMLRAYADLETCVAIISHLAQEKAELRIRLDKLESEVSND